MASLETISFIIPVRNDAKLLSHCLASIKANRTAASGVQIIVADNGSTDGSAEVAADAGAEVLVRPGLPVGRLRNEAAGRATGEVLAFVDADHEIGSEWVAAALAGLTQTGAAGIGALCHTPSQATWVQRAYDRLRQRPSELTEVEWLGAGNLAVRAAAFHAVGGFDIALESCEDVDLCNRLRSRGLTLVNEPRMHNVHFGDPATLRRLFLGELWRGRDNLRVTLRGPLTFRALPSVLLPVANLCALVGGVLLALATRQARWLWLPAFTLGVSAALRVSRMSLGAGRGALFDLVENAAVAITYEVARALALLLRASHDVRRGGSA
jgi:GT2 family glycosyltransferase